VSGGTFVALLRGVNVGKAKRVPMAALRALLAGLGHGEVATLLNSGNALFRAEGDDPAAHAAAIAAALRSEVGVDAPVVVLRAETLLAAVAEIPFEVAPDAHARLLVAFAQAPEALAGVAAVEPLVAPTERFAIGAHAAYLFCPDGVLQSRAGEALVGKAGRGACTTRNWATTLKLAALAAARVG
jgi:uncharacterized protein (DUF1697 family)